MKQFYTQVDLRSREAMTNFLVNHFRYSTMNSWNCSTSYANNLKIYNLGLTLEQEDKLYQMIDVAEYYDELRELIDEFGYDHAYLWQVGFNGRSGGYLVFYQAYSQPSQYKSFCRKCGQKNYRSVKESNAICGRCGAEARVDFAKPPSEIGVYPGRETDMNEDFEDWDMYSLRERVKLVQDFDWLCDNLLARTVKILDCCDVAEKIVMRPEKVKVLCEVAL